MRALDKISRVLNRALMGVAGVFLVGMIVLTCANIVSRLIVTPISGTFELMGYAGAVVAAFALGYTHIKRGHIAVDVLTDRFSQKIKNILYVVNTILCTAFFIIAAWQIAKLATNLLQTGEVTETLRIVYYPFSYAVALGCAVLSLTLLIDLIKIWFPEKGENR